MDQNGITFIVADTKLNDKYPPEQINLVDYMAKTKIVTDNNGRILKTSSVSENLVAPDLGNGFVGAALRAYNKHYHLVISPDDVWIAITTALAGEINRHSEEMRHLFVNHTDKKELVVYGGGNIMSANYDRLVDLMSEEIEKNTKDNIKSWMECNFSTSTLVTKTISKIVLMGSMKNYFSYKMCLDCGLPKVTLQGNIGDWQEIRKRVELLSTWNIESLSKWSVVLQSVLDKFVDAFNGKVDVNFWNGIAYRTGGGSGPRYLQGWILAFIPFNDVGKYILNDMTTIMTAGKYGKVDTNDVPTSAVEVPVTIDDNGTIYQTIFYGGAIVSKKFDAETIGTSLDWVLIDVTKQ